MNMPKKRCPIIAEVIGYGFSSNGNNISQPSDIGSMIAMERALKKCKHKTQRYRLRNAHATSTPKVMLSRQLQ
jgi:3-oxoacyl-[acyl-carrier-protein] synthase-1